MKQILEAKGLLTVKNVILDRHMFDVRRIYISAFPANERMPFPMMIAMSLLWHTKFLSFYDGDTLCGLQYLATMGKTTFVMFFAVDEKMRCKGYGSRILATLRAIKPNNKIILSIEPCGEEFENCEERENRKRFYLKNGYKETGYMTRLAGQTQEILIQNGEFDRSQFRRFFMIYSNLLILPKVWSIKNHSGEENENRNQK